MKSFLFLLLITIAYSCGSSYDLDLPSTYTSSSVEILQITAYRYTAGDYVEIPLSEAGEPTTSGIRAGSNILMLIDDGMLSFDDGFGTVTTEYDSSSDAISFTAGGSRYRMEIGEDDNLYSRRVGGGSLDELNPSVTVSATCEDEGCDDVSPSGYLFSSTEGQIGYIVIYNEVFTKI